MMMTMMTTAATKTMTMSEIAKQYDYGIGGVITTSSSSTAATCNKSTPLITRGRRKSRLSAKKQ
jgi:hypothetical protein